MMDRLFNLFVWAVCVCIVLSVLVEIAGGRHVY
jgi:hypothetical protein